MCEFKIIRKNDGSLLAEEILLLSYGEENELLFKDILGGGEKSDSALILNVNTMDQTTIILEHPLVKDFIGLMRALSEQTASKIQIDKLKNKLDELKATL